MTNVRGLTGVVAVASGDSHSCALLKAGTVKCWGSNSGGQLGNGTVADYPAPVGVIGLTNAVAIVAGSDHTCALGNGTIVNSAVPSSVSGLTGVTEVSAGGEHACAQLAAGGVRCWGGNVYGQLGNGTIVDRRKPVAVIGL